jgi:hypothetical protein
MTMSSTQRLAPASVASLTPFLAASSAGGHSGVDRVHQGSSRAFGDFQRALSDALAPAELANPELLCFFLETEDRLEVPGGSTCLAEDWDSRCVSLLDGVGSDCPRSSSPCPTGFSKVRVGLDVLA